MLLPLIGAHRVHRRLPEADARPHRAGGRRARSPTSRSTPTTSSRCRQTRSAPWPSRRAEATDATERAADARWPTRHVRRPVGRLVRPVARCSCSLGGAPRCCSSSARSTPTWPQAAGTRWFTVASPPVAGGRARHGPVGRRRPTTGRPRSSAARSPSTASRCSSRSRSASPSLLVALLTDDYLRRRGPRRARGLRPDPAVAASAAS